MKCGEALLALDEAPDPRREGMIDPPMVWKTAFPEYKSLCTGLGREMRRIGPRDLNRPRTPGILNSQG